MPWVGQLVMGKKLWCNEPILFRSEKKDAVVRVSSAVIKYHDQKRLGEESFVSVTF